MKAPAIPKRVVVDGETVFRIRQVVGRPLPGLILSRRRRLRVFPLLKTEATTALLAR